MHGHDQCECTVYLCALSSSAFTTATRHTLDWQVDFASRSYTHGVLNSLSSDDSGKSISTNKPGTRWWKIFPFLSVSVKLESLHSICDQEVWIGVEPCGIYILACLAYQDFTKKTEYNSECKDNTSSLSEFTLYPPLRAVFPMRMIFHHPIIDGISNSY